VTGSWSWSLRGLLFALAVVWGLNFLVIKIGLSEATPLWLSFLRAAVGAGATVALVTPFHAWGQLGGRGRRDAMLIGIPQTTGMYLLLFLGTDQVAPGFASVLLLTMPVWTALLSPAILGHRLTPGLSAAVGVGFAGVVLFSEPWSGFRDGAGAVAILELLGAAVSWAIGTVLLQRRFAAPQMLEANAFQLAGGAVGLGVLALIFGRGSAPAPSLNLVLILAWLGILGTAVGYTIWAYLLGRTQATTLSAYIFLAPLVALVASALLLGERVDLVQGSGAALVLASVYYVGRSHGVPDRGPRRTAKDPTHHPLAPAGRVRGSITRQGEEE
jgi:drug/metabolite transporter (DMT)-like permease